MIKIEIDNKHKGKIIWLLNKGMEITKSESKFNFYEQILDEFLQSESTESVSGSSQESGVSHAVRDRNANGEVSPQELEPVAEALEIRTDSDSDFMCQAIWNDKPCDTNCGDKDCLFYPEITKES